MNKHDRFLFYLLTAFLFGSILFLVGFFPVNFEKSGVPPSSKPPTTLNGIRLKRPTKQVSNVILMVVDAMRYDFVSRQQMPHASQHCKIKMKVNIPTVTMPRIKSLTSGTISNFIDVVLNVGSSQPLEDSILHNLHKRGDKIVFYGDFTWVDLFSKLFHRYEANTDSFYLQEFYEGDKNITRSLSEELKNFTTWDFLILHYIGLDRIGHMESSDGEKIFLKLREMDDVVEQIDKVLSGKSAETKPLLLVTADHGMRNGGGHGGSTPEELNVPLIISGRNCSKQDKIKRPAKQVSNVILMLVDALRYDFVSNQHMPYSNEQCKVKIKVDSPTVTLPRIKSLSSGTISNFIDVVLNLDSSQPLQDSILHKLHKRGDKIVFYGDCTWEKLFFNFFKRYWVVNDSYFLKEFYEGDKNITRSLLSELKNLTSWDFLILHYSGLDHIGHMESSYGEKIFLKLKEMDDVIKQIDKVLSGKAEKSKSLVLVTAEIYVPLIISGQDCLQRSEMTLQYNQIDITPTLAVLLDVPIPSASIGCIIPELIENMSDEDKLYALYYNTKFLVDKAVAKFGKIKVEKQDFYLWYKTASESHKDYLTKLIKDNTNSAYLFEQSKLNYIRSAQQVSQLLAGSYTRFDFGTIILGVAMTIVTTILVLLMCMTIISSHRKTREPGWYYARVLLVAFSINIISHVFNFLHTSNFLLMCLTTIPILIIVFLVSELLKLLTASRMHFYLDIPLSIVFGILFQTFSLTSTSFIEEEHQIWYYLGTTFLLSLIWKNISRTRLKVATFTSSSMERDILIFFSVLRPLRRAFVAVAITIFVRRLNQTGDKWMREPDIGDWLMESNNKNILSAFLGISLLLLVLQLRKFNTPLQTVACIIACATVYCYRGAIDLVLFFHAKDFNSFLVLPFFWTSVIYILASSYLPVISGVTDKANGANRRLCKLLGTNLTVFALISALLHKPHNVFLVYAMHLLLRCGYNLCDNLLGPKKTMPAQIILVYKVALTICVSRMFYFYQGNSNSLATIDLNPGYIGLTHYNAILVATMITANTYFSEIFGFLHLLLNITEKESDISIIKETNEFENNLNEKNNYNLVTQLMASIKLLNTSVYLILMLAFRHHLFIYTVFSPKLLYECFAIFLFYMNFSMTNLYLSVLYKIFKIYM